MNDRQNLSASGSEYLSTQAGIMNQSCPWPKQLLESRPNTYLSNTMLSRSAKDTVCFTVVCFLALITSVFAGCTREGLLAAANSYVAAFSAGQLDGLQLASSNFTCQKNNKAADIKRRLLSQSHNISLN